MASLIWTKKNKKTKVACKVCIAVMILVKVECQTAKYLHVHIGEQRDYTCVCGVGGGVDTNNAGTVGLLCSTDRRCCLVGFHKNCLFSSLDANSQ